MITTLLVLLVGLVAGVTGFMFGHRRGLAACADLINTHRQRADAIEQTLADYRKTSAAQIDHAFSMCHRIVSEVKGQMQTTREALASAVEMTKKAAAVILPPDFSENDAGMQPRSIADADRAVARERRAEIERDERRG